MKWFCLALLEDLKNDYMKVAQARDLVMVGSRGFSKQEKCGWPLLVSLLLVLKRIIEQVN